MQQIVATRTFSLCFSSPVSLSLLCPDSRKNEYPFLGREESISSNKHLGAYQQPTCLLEELCSLVPALRPAQLRVPFTTSWGHGHRESAGATGLRCTATGAVAAQYEAPEDAIAGGKGFSYLLQTVLWRLQVTDLLRVHRAFKGGNKICQALPFIIIITILIFCFCFSSTRLEV